MKGRTISDQDQKAVRKKLQKLIPKKLRSTRSANTISNKDLETLEKTYLQEDALRSDGDETASPNSISNRDVKILEEALKRNDGGMARKTRVF